MRRNGRCEGGGGSDPKDGLWGVMQVDEFFGCFVRGEEEGVVYRVGDLDRCRGRIVVIATRGRL